LNSIIREMNLSLEFLYVKLITGSSDISLFKPISFHNSINMSN